MLKALGHVRDIIAPALQGMDITRQTEIDLLMIELDGTPNKSRLGANAILGVSMACARAASISCGLPLYAYLGGSNAVRIPVPLMNVLNGGKYAYNSWDFQEFMIAPIGAPCFAETIRYRSETFHALKKILKKKELATSVGDEGGFAPNLGSNEKACEVILEATNAAGYEPGKDIALALDPAASSFFADGAYHLSKSGQETKSTYEVINLWQKWLDTYPIVLLEDGRDENDWQEFAQLTARIGHKAQIHWRRSLCDQHPVHRTRDQGKSQQRGALQTEPDRHRDGNNPCCSDVPQGRLEFPHVPPFRRDGGFLSGRFLRGHGRRAWRIIHVS